jgi:hypothetical protein
MRQQRLFLYYDFKSCAIQPVEATLGTIVQAMVLGSSKARPHPLVPPCARRRKLRTNIVCYSPSGCGAPQRIAVRLMFAQIDCAAIDLIDS